MQNPANYFVCAINYGRLGTEASVDPEMTWAGALEAVNEAAGDGRFVDFVHHIHDGLCQDRTQEALNATLNAIADNGEPLTPAQRDWVEHHFGIATANAFKRAA